VIHTGIPCDITICPNEATWAFIGECGDLYLCDEHFDPAVGNAAHWYPVPRDELI